MRVLISKMFQKKRHVFCYAAKSKGNESSGVNLTKYDQLDPFLVSYTKQHFIHRPGKGCSRRIGKPETIWKILEKVVDDPNGEGSGGIFVEAGAADGTTESNTLWLETEKNWTGLLVECHPEAVPLLLSKQRKAYVSTACLSAYSHPVFDTITSMDGWYYSSSLSKATNIYPDFAKSFTKYKVQSIPLYSQLAAVNFTVIDFFSLDVQHLELQILQNFPFGRIFVKVLYIEVNLYSPEDRIKLTTLMRNYNYDGPTHPTSTDEIYVHKSLKKRLG